MTMQILYLVEVITLFNSRGYVGFPPESDSGNRYELTVQNFFLKSIANNQPQKHIM